MHFKIKTIKAPQKCQFSFGKGLLIPASEQSEFSIKISTEVAKNFYLLLLIPYSSHPTGGWYTNTQFNFEIVYIWSSEEHKKKIIFKKPIFYIKSI